MAVGDAAHRVREMLVEAGEEAKPVLAWQRQAPVSGRAGYREAPSLPPERVSRLEDAHTEAALAELMSRAQSRHPATKHDHPVGHLGSNLRLAGSE